MLAKLETQIIERMKKESVRSAAQKTGIKQTRLWSIREGVAKKRMTLDEADRCLNAFYSVAWMRNNLGRLVNENRI